MPGGSRSCKASSSIFGEDGLGDGRSVCYAYKTASAAFDLATARAPPTVLPAAAASGAPRVVAKPSMRSRRRRQPRPPGPAFPWTPLRVALLHLLRERGTRV